MDAQGFNIRNLKVAYRLIFYGLDSCITCAILYPLINLASKNDLISVVEPNIFSKKENYKNYIQKLLNMYTDEYDSTVPVPVLLIQLTPTDELKLVSPGVITEIAMTLSDKLDSFEKLSFIDGETEINYFFVNMLQKLSSNLLDKLEP